MIIIIDVKIISWNEFFAKLGYDSYTCCNQYDFEQNFVTQQYHCIKCKSKVPPIVADHLPGKRILK